MHDVPQLIKDNHTATSRRKTQNDLADALRMAQAANEAKSAFLSSVSHDIRTPMNFGHLLGDKMRLNRILLNLLSNAVKYGTMLSGKPQRSVFMILCQSPSL